MPIIIGQLGQMLITAGDVYIATLFSTHSVAAIGVAGGIINPIFLFGIGLMIGISPSLAFLRGEGVSDKDHLFSIIIYSLVVGVATSIILVVFSDFIDNLGIEASLIPSIKLYISIVAWSLPFAIVFQGIKEYLQAFEKVFFPNLLSIVAVIFNLGLNYILVFGMGPIKGMGEVGLAYASLIIRILLCLCLLVYVLRDYPIKAFSKKLIQKIFKFSLPIAFMFFLEVLGFCTVSILSGKLGVIEAATNNIIMTIASISFMIPLSLSSAVAVKIGHSYGLRDKEMILDNIKGVLIATLFFILCSISFFIVLPFELMNFMSKNQDVVTLGVELLMIVAIFQLSDGLQVVLSGVLRGMNNTTLSSVMVLIGYWIIGIPTGYYLTFYAGYGAKGLWMGLAISLILVAVSLSIGTYKEFRGLNFENR